MNQPVDILAFGAHADDIEIGMGGTIVKWSKRGSRVVLCDLTKAELSSNGTPEIRQNEASTAGEILGVTKRINLSLPDRGITSTPEQINAVVDVIRKYKPRILFAPYEVDRHPDHGNASRLITEAAFSASIHRYKTNLNRPAHKSLSLYYYMINGFHHPDFVVDISSEMDIKMKSLLAYKSQFQPEKGVETPLTDGYVEGVKARDRLFGKEVQVAYAEGFMSAKPVVLDYDLLGDER
ncbi:bacillithiol biosynthesis deacetylase BshB1 [Jeotgalibacillus soli]|uniref:Deacetylase n=1 Tax=Jeotgalibacillus soli TaxID=889306 RepID=A0A0C2VI45_9BACL|nr:bacillithiol biosynthesis deacetylase BshB1 [Jeotgalibacillus soli]KIL44181.1 hypothetical protein KP78_31450 [Jeotgalibacillus soli]